MNPKEVSKGQAGVWLWAAMAAPLAKAASGCTWPAVLLIGTITLFIGWWLGNYSTEPKPWLVILQGLWASLVIGELLYWIGACWPGHSSPKAAPLILLTLAAWAACGGRVRVARIGCVLIWPVGLLLGAVLISSISEIRPDNLMPSWQMRDAGLIPVLLFTALYGNREKPACGGLQIGLLGFTLLTTVAVAGVLSPWVSGRTESALYELTRSVQILGVADRFESVIAAGMTMGYCASLSYLLSIPEEVDKRRQTIWIYAGIAGALFVVDIRIDSRILAIGSILLWAVVPALCGIKKIFQKPPETA